MQFLSLSFFLFIFFLSQIPSFSSSLSALSTLKEKLFQIKQTTQFTNNGGGCSYPLPDKNFDFTLYEGKWYEIGKIQTKGGAFFEKDCVCTELNIVVTNSPYYGDALADNDCRYQTITGKWTNVTGNLYQASNPPGNWLENFYDGNPVNYTVIAIDENYAVEYDCGTNLGITNYCVHVMSRNRTMEEEIFNEFIDMAEEMGLNPQKLPVTKTLQEGC